MTDWNTILTISGIIIGAIISLAALFAGVGYFRQGRTQAKLDTTTLLKEQIDALETKVKNQTIDIAKLSKEVHELHIAIDEKDKKLNETLSILQGRDPQFQLFVEMMKKYIETNVPLLETIKTKTVPTIERLETYLNKQQF